MVDNIARDGHVVQIQNTATTIVNTAVRRNAAAGHGIIGDSRVGDDHRCAGNTPIASGASEANQSSGKISGA